jgi:hypothetical protein
MPKRAGGWDPFLTRFLNSGALFVLVIFVGYLGHAVVKQEQGDKGHAFASAVQWREQIAIDSVDFVIELTSFLR